jgi:FtsP/CotA-like multicopper oxidase with cupredoxin domain
MAITHLLPLLTCLCGVLGSPYLSTDIPAATSPPTCPPGAFLRTCTTFETPPCPCPGQSNVVSVSLFLREVVQRQSTWNKTLFTVNGTVPGPELIFDEGDTVKIHVTNLMSVPSVIHWHGMVQVTTMYSDGVPGVTQRLIYPDEEVTYTFTASPAGTYWYHGHFNDQYTDGLFGPLIIRPRYQTDYIAADDVTFMIQDYYKDDAHSLIDIFYLTPESGGDEPIPNFVNVNGQMSETLFVTVDRSRVSKFRFIASNALSVFNISIDGVVMSIVEVDGSAVEPYPVSFFSLNVAQRVVVEVDWSTVDLMYDRVWLTVNAIAEMYPINITGYIPPYEDTDENDGDADDVVRPFFRGTIRLSSDGTSLPTTTPSICPSCLGIAPSDFNLLAARPVYVHPAPDPTHSLYLETVFDSDDLNINRAFFNGVTLPPEPYVDTPLLYAVKESPKSFGPSAFNAANYSFDPELKAIGSNGKGAYYLPYGAVVDILINNTDGGDHPFHFHGHSFWIIATGEYPEAEQLYRDNYLDRDVVTVPAESWAKIRIVADNPGVWTFHCHIEWHVAAGLVSMFYEASDLIDATIPPDFLELSPASHTLSPSLMVLIVSALMGWFVN